MQHCKAIICCCCCSVIKSCPTLCKSMDCSTPGFPVLHYLPNMSLHNLMSIESVMQSTHLIHCCPFLLLPPIFPASGSFPMSQLFTSGGWITEASVSKYLTVSVLSSEEKYKCTYIKKKNNCATTNRTFRIPWMTLRPWIPGTTCSKCDSGPTRDPWLPGVYFILE